MNRGIRIVAPFRPFPPESPLHLELAAFDWTDAIRMMAHSAALACHCPVSILTDVDTDVPIHAFKYRTLERRLMLWTLEVICRYLESEDFDRDTVCLDIDQLIYKDLAVWMTPYWNLGVCVRVTPKHQQLDGQPLLNGVQWFARSHRGRLVRFYQAALELARTLPEDRIRWGADTDAVRLLLEPLEVGIQDRAGLRVNMIAADGVLEALSELQIAQLGEGRLPWPTRPVLDFRWKRKPYMRAVYEATILKGAAL